MDDPLAAALIDPAVPEGSLEGDTSVADEPPAEDLAEVEDFGNVDLATEEPAVAEPAAEPAAEPETAEAVADAFLAGEPPAAPGAIRFGRRTAEDKARSLARSLVSDLIAYNPDKHKEALAAGTLPEVFGEEIDKSLKEYQEQVEADVIAKGTFFNDALNSILAEDNSIFSLDA